MSSGPRYIFIPIFMSFAMALASLMRVTAQHAEEIALRGLRLSPSEAANLERKLAAHPEDRNARIELLGYYSNGSYESSEKTAARQRHLLWMVEHRPDDPFLKSGFADLNKDRASKEYGVVKRAWLLQVAKHPANAKILGNAAQYFLLAESATAERLLKKAESVDPKNAEWPGMLGHLYSFEQSNQAGEINVKVARQSLLAYERAAKVARAEERYYQLGNLAKAAYDAAEYDKAKTYADELLKGADRGFPVGVDGDAIHHGNIILGRIALRAGKKEEAKKYLLAAGKTPGSPPLDSFGPNMILAKELLEKGERETVLEYFALCSKFWHREELDTWSNEVKAGKVPDFGANLVY
jgi:hypothetical protein